MKTKPHFKQGAENKIAFVFSCPGRHEEVAGYPAAGTTGKNLDSLLDILNSSKIRDYQFTRNSITITNSWDKVEYKAKTNRTQATTEEILQFLNLQRLAMEISHVEDYIVCCGDKAMIAVCAVKCQNKIIKNCRLIFINHLGTRGLNTIKNDIYGKPIIATSNKKKTSAQKAIGKENTARRIEVIANIIEDEMRQDC